MAYQSKFKGIQQGKFDFAPNALSGAVAVEQDEAQLPFVLRIPHCLVKVVLDDLKAVFELVCAARSWHGARELLTALAVVSLWPRRGLPSLQAVRAGKCECSLWQDLPDAFQRKAAFCSVFPPSIGHLAGDSIYLHRMSLISCVCSASP